MAGTKKTVTNTKENAGRKNVKKAPTTGKTAKAAAGKNVKTAVGKTMKATTGKTAKAAVEKTAKATAGKAVKTEHAITHVTKDMKKKLVAEALLARKNSYSPYSKFAVGAALLCKNGKIYRGTNVENAAYGLTVCAERSAILTAVTKGEREFAAIAVVGGPAGQPATELCAPCGSCRQVMAEFAKPADFMVILGKEGNDYTEHTLAEMLPYAFGEEIR